MDRLTNPEQFTYFIAWEGDVVHYGTNDTNQSTGTALANFETFTSEALYEDRLADFDIELEEEI